MRLCELREQKKYDSYKLDPKLESRCTTVLDQVAPSVRRGALEPLVPASDVVRRSTATWVFRCGVNSGAGTWGDCNVHIKTLDTCAAKVHGEGRGYIEGCGRRSKFGP